MISRTRTLLTLGVFMIAAASTRQDPGKLVEWPVYGGDPGGSRYSTLADINRDNVRGLTRVISPFLHSPARFVGFFSP